MFNVDVFIDDIESMSDNENNVQTVLKNILQRNLQSIGEIVALTVR